MALEKAGEETNGYLTKSAIKCAHSKHQNSQLEPRMHVIHIVFWLSPVMAYNRNNKQRKGPRGNLNRKKLNSDSGSIMAPDDRYRIGFNQHGSVQIDSSRGSSNILLCFLSPYKQISLVGQKQTNKIDIDGPFA